MIPHAHSSYFLNMVPRKGKYSPGKSTLKANTEVYFMIKTFMQDKTHNLTYGYSVYVSRTPFASSLTLSKKSL